MKKILVVFCNLTLLGSLWACADKKIDEGGVNEDDRFAGYGEALDAPLDEWSYHEFSNAVCGNGDPLGIGVFPSSSSTKVLIYLEGGGACWDAQTCNSNIAAFVKTGIDQAQAENFFAFAGTRSIFSRTDESNPFKDYSLVYVPYCTGDIHSGSRSDNSYGVEHKGYDNMSAFLNRLVPTLSDATEVILSGSSAGGFGATINYDQVREAFIDLPVQLLIDSAPPVTTNLYPIGLYNTQTEAWNTAVSQPDYCVIDDDDICPEGHSRFMRFIETHPESRVALITSTGDNVLRQFFGLETFPPRNITAEQYEVGIRELAAILEPFDNVKIFVDDSTKHVYLRDEPFGGLTVNGTSIGTFVEGFLANDANFRDVIAP